MSSDQSKKANAKPKAKAKPAAADVEPQNTLQAEPVETVIVTLPVDSAVEPVPEADSGNQVSLGPVLRKKELVDLVVTHSGMKKKDVKPVVESMLAVLGEALAENREFNLRPFGQLKVRNAREVTNGRMVVAKIRQPRPQLSEEETPNIEADPS